MKTEWIIF